MWLSKVTHFINIIAKSAARGANVVAASALIAMMFLTGTDVTLRYIFNSPIPGSLELTEFLMAIVVGLALAHCALDKGHLRVDLVVSRLPKQVQLVLHSIASFTFLGLFILITWKTVDRAWAMFDDKIESAIFAIPAFPFVLAVAVGSAVLCLVLMKEFIDDLRLVVKK